MTRKKGKSVSFDAMVKFFMQHYNIPTRADIDRLAVRLDRIESMLHSVASGGRSGAVAARRTSKRTAGEGSATDRVLEVIQGRKEGAGVNDIQEATAFDTKKIRNILYRLHKTGKIERADRGVYKAA